MDSREDTKLEMSDEQVEVSQEKLEANKSSIVAQEQDMTAPKSKQEKRVILKQDFTIVLLLSGCYFFAYLDRGAIGNARVMGFQKDLNLTDSQYFNCLMMFFVGYMVFELPAALSLRVIHPQYAFGGAVVSFGVFACCMSTVRGYAPVMVLRTLLGLGEAWVQCGFVFLTLWYTRGELTTRCAFYFVSAPVAGAVSGLLAYGVEKNLDGVFGKSAWEWLFLIEGIPSIAWGLAICLMLPKLPETVAKRGSWLFPHKEELEIVLRRTIQARNTPDAKLAPFQIWWALKDVKTWLGALVTAAAALNIAAFGSFLPTFIKEFGYSRLHTQLLTIIPYCIATVTLPLAAYLADRFQQKAVPTLLCLSVSLVGFIMLLASSSKGVLLTGCCLVAAGSFPALVTAAAWLVTTHGGYTKRATAFSVTQIFIQCYSIISTQIYTEPPHFYKGHGTLLGLNAVGVLAAVINYWIMKRENMKRDAIASQHVAEGTVNPDQEKSLEELCDYHPNFRYAL